MDRQETWEILLLPVGKVRIDAAYTERELAIEIAGREVQSTRDLKTTAKAGAFAHDDLPSSRERMTRVRLTFSRRRAAGGGWIVRSEDGNHVFRWPPECDRVTIHHDRSLNQDLGFPPWPRSARCGPCPLPSDRVSCRVLHPCA